MIDNENGSERKLTPRDFPVLMTRKEVRNDSVRRTWPVCAVCRLVVEPRNRLRHQRACARRKRLAPELWEEWWKDMHAQNQQEGR